MYTARLKHIRSTFRGSWLISITTLLLAAIMMRLSYWQWTRHVAKQELIQHLNHRLDQTPVPLTELLTSSMGDWSQLPFRRVTVRGVYDYQHEMVLRNRRHEGVAGVFLLTPLRIADSPDTILVNRGFIPLALAEPGKRSRFHNEPTTEVLLLLKEGQHPQWLGPRDPPTGPSLPWVDAWLRVDLEGMSRQIPSPLLPIYGELMDEKDIKLVRQRLVRSDSERDEILSLASRKAVGVQDFSEIKVPIPTFDIVVPPGRHLGYVFEWGLLALGTLTIGVLIQRRG